jgi:hypothetical protein
VALTSVKKVGGAHMYHLVAEVSWAGSKPCPSSTIELDGTVEVDVSVKPTTTGSSKLILAMPNSSNSVGHEGDQGLRTT